jgi:hypothetical protein
MAPRVRYGIFGVIGIIGLILLVSHPLIGIVLIAAAIAIPVVAFRALSPGQRRRIRENRRRKQIGG